MNFCGDIKNALVLSFCFRALILQALIAHHLLPYHRRALFRIQVKMRPSQVLGAVFVAGSASAAAIDVVEPLRTCKSAPSTHHHQQQK